MIDIEKQAMNTSEAADLDSLIDFINEDDFDDNFEATNDVANHNVKKNEEKSNEKDLDSLLDLINESDSISEKPCSSSSAKLKLNDDMSLLFPTAAKKAETSCPSQSLEQSLIHTGLTSSEDESDKEFLTETGQQIKKKICPKSYHDRQTKREKKDGSSVTWKNKSNVDSTAKKEKPTSIDTLSGVRIVKPVVPADVMEKRMLGRKVIKMSFMKNFMNKGDIEGDWVTIGVVVQKIPPKTSKNGKLFSIWKLCDLLNIEKIVSLFLFGTVHNEHWKTAVGTVIGLLNPSFMEGKDREDYATIKVDHPGKIMVIGTSKDFGHCKSKRKDGSQCTSIINMSQCQHCAYHVKKEYMKFSKRSEIQTSYSGRGLTMKDKVLKGQNFFYAGQSFSPLGKPERKSAMTVSSKDKLTLSNLGLKRKAAEVFNEEKGKSVKKVAEMLGEDIAKVAVKNSDFINQKLTVPSAGSRNLLQHMIKQTPREQNIAGLDAKDLLKLRTSQMTKKKTDSEILQKLIPVLGKGLSPGQNITLDFSSPPSNSKATEHYAKLRAIQKIKESGPIQKKNPNSVKSNPEPRKIKAVLENSFEEKTAEDKTPENKPSVARSKLGCIDLNSEKIQSILNRKSSHAYEIEMAEMEKEAAYFDRLEKKEMMEEKMSATKEIVCDVVSCKQCRYTAHKAADRCKSENHPLKCHKALKRFFECKDCKHRTDCYSRFPLKSCSNCGGSRFERTGMLKIRSGPKLDSEILNIASDEAYFLNSL